ncbi:CPBP family intramembrane glutamic endopeptidase [Clostridium sp.]|uniref:CPBP family intramembrane glutamic endopeptidase n=1 Tax=Clostridium sp. TaxID=1506 RepID=UPI002633EE4B|nr:CPBP family intramembrane glutamic endopeptidase [Clostridium sp.]
MFIKNRSLQIIFFVLIGCIVMSLVEGVIQPGYIYKSLIKIFTFTSLIIIYSYINKDFSYFNIFKITSKKDLSLSIFMGLIVYLVITSAYFIAKSFIDLNEISANLMSKENISKDNFIFVAIYISLINSLLEEMFFRGFAFITLRNFISLKFAYIFSALTFSLYHVFIMKSWFNPLLFILLLSSLIIAGLIFNYFDRRSVIYNSWLIHMSANLAINTIGLIMFKII